jgi:hypothetical protein
VRLPSFLLPKDVSMDMFEAALKSFIKKMYPELKIDQDVLGTIRQYFLERRGRPVVEMAVIPKAYERLEVRVARLRGAELYNPLTGESYEDHEWSYRHGSVNWRHADGDFCIWFYDYIGRTFGIDIGIPRLYYPDGVIDHIIETVNEQAEYEFAIMQHLHDGLAEGCNLDFSREGITYGIYTESANPSRWEMPPIIDVDSTHPITVSNGSTNGRIRPEMQAAEREQVRQGTSIKAEDAKRKPGRPKLSWEERLKRYAKAQEAQELRTNSGMTWPEAASAVGWCRQHSKTDVKKLQKASNDLQNESADVLAQVRAFREKEKKEKKEKS